MESHARYHCARSIGSRGIQKGLCFVFILRHAAKSLQWYLTLWDPIDGSPPGSATPGFSRQEHWSGLPFPSPMHENEKGKWSRSCPTLWDPMNCSTPGLSVHHQHPEFTQTHVHPVSDAIQLSHLCRPLLLLPSIFPSIRVFSNMLALRIRWTKYWSFSFNISPSNEYSGSISFRTDCFDLAVQGTLKSLLQHHSSKVSILWNSAWLFWTVQLSNHTWLLRFVIAFLPRSKHLLISWLQWPSTVLLEPEKTRSVTVSIFPPSICHEVIGPDAMISIFWMLSFKPAFSVSSSTFTKRPFSSSLLSAIKVVSSEA